MRCVLYMTNMVNATLAIVISKEVEGKALLSFQLLDLHYKNLTLLQALGSTSHISVNYRNRNNCERLRCLENISLDFTYYGEGKTVNFVSCR